MKIELEFEYIRLYIYIILYLTSFSSIYRYLDIYITLFAFIVINKALGVI